MSRICENPFGQKFFKVLSAKFFHSHCIMQRIMLGQNYKKRYYILEAVLLSLFANNMCGKTFGKLGIFSVLYFFIICLAHLTVFVNEMCENFHRVVCAFWFQECSSVGFYAFSGKNTTNKFYYSFLEYVKSKLAAKGGLSGHCLCYNLT